MAWDSVGCHELSHLIRVLHHPLLELLIGLVVVDIRVLRQIVLRMRLLERIRGRSKWLLMHCMMR